MLLTADNTPLPSVKSWLAERLAIFYHNIGSISPSCPTLAKVKELDFACLRVPRTSLCAATKQYNHTTSCSIISFCCFVLLFAKGEKTMTEKEREIFYRLLVDLFIDNPKRKQPHATERSETHENIPTSEGKRRTRTRRRIKRKVGKCKRKISSSGGNETVG